MTGTVTPIGDIPRRLPEAGRIRIGVKGGKQGRMSIDTFRFTSADEAALAKLAQLYGGEVRPWDEPKANPGQFELRTQAKEISVALPPEPLSTFYELWTGGGNLRRCDGATCDLNGHEGRTEVPCICDTRGAMECSLKVRLSVLIPEVRFLGTWRLDTGSWNAAHEMPGMVDLICSLQGRGIHRAILRNEARTEQVAGKRKKVQVPVLGVDDSLDVLSPVAPVGQLPAPPPPLGGELGAGPDDRPVGWAAGEATTFDRKDFVHGRIDDEPVDAVIVEPITTFDPVTGEHEVNVGLTRMWLEQLGGPRKNRALIRARELAIELGEPIPTTAMSITPLIADHLMKENFD